jgi:glycosyltransferase involved in cell wall biosynthesis
MGSQLRVSVVVPSRGRALRLRWLLNALEEQSLPREEWEVIVVHDDDYGDLLATHPVGVREIVAPPCGPALKRNLGWRAATAPLIAFTDNDTRPPADWLGNVVAAAARHPGAIVQGATRPDPDEADLLRAPHARSVTIDPPSLHAQTCNIAYPRAVLQALDGFDAEALPGIGGEDADLAFRARAAGVAYVAAPEVLTFHMVETPGLIARARFGWRWRQLPAMARRHPALREHGIFWKARHRWFLVAALGVLGARRHPAALLLALPWARDAAPSYGPGARGRLRAVSELPGQAVVDGVEVAALAVGSVQHRTLFL